MENTSLITITKTKHTLVIKSLRQLTCYLFENNKVIQHLLLKILTYLTIIQKYNINNTYIYTHVDVYLSFLRDEIHTWGF